MYVQTIMPLEKGHEKTERLMKINERFRSIEDKKFIMVDTFSKMTGNNNYIPSNYTSDGVHLTNAGYDKWSSILKAYLK